MVLYRSSIAFLITLAIYFPCAAFATDVVEVKEGEELILEPLPGSVKSGALAALSVGAGDIVRETRKRAIAKVRGLRTLARGARHGDSVLVEKSDLESACARYVAEGFRCSPNVIVSIAADPNDTYFSLLYGMDKISAQTAWTTTTGTGTVVAVVDTGIKYNHEDLDDNIAINTNEVASNGVDDDGNGYIDDVYGFNAITWTGTSSSSGNPMDDNGHGSHVAGTIAAIGNNSTGVIGVAHGAKVLAVKALGATGSGSISDVVEGIDFAIQRGVDVINLSLGTSTDVPSLEAAIQDAGTHGILVVAAAGNSSENIDVTPAYPAAYSLSNLIAVAATTSSDALASFSNYGATTVHLAAPGEEIASTYYDGSYVYLDGTSMAAPHVAGAAALVKAANSSLTAAQIKSALINTTDTITGLSGKVSSSGRLNAAAAVAAAVSGDLGGGGGSSDDGEAISVSTRRASARATRVSGLVYDTGTSEVTSGVTVRLVCRSRVRGTKVSSGDGTIVFSVRRPAIGKSSLSCYLASDAAQSRTFRIKALR